MLANGAQASRASVEGPVGRANLPGCNRTCWSPCRRRESKTSDGMSEKKGAGGAMAPISSPPTLFVRLSVVAVVVVAWLYQDLLECVSEM
jgi:hypothetical protein